MEQQSAQMESLLGWWQLAGVEEYCGVQAVNWLEAPPVAPRLARAPVATAPQPKHASSPVTPEPAKPVPSGPAPTSLDALHERLRRVDDLPGTQYGQARALPHGPVDASLMIVSDCPDEDDLAAGTILSGATGTLLRNMLSAIGIDMAACYRASLSVTRPASGRLPAADIAPMADLMRRHIVLARPQNLLLLGTGASEALTGDPIVKARGILHDFNQDGGRKALVATYHPRTLLKRPHCKRQAWDDLQLLLKEGNW